METLILSENAVAVLRLPHKGLCMPVTATRLQSYRELAEAGIMEPHGDDFRFTENGWARREEFIAAAEAYHRSLESRLPERIELSGAARRTLTRYLTGEKEVTDANRNAYRELAGPALWCPSAHSVRAMIVRLSLLTRDGSTVTSSSVLCPVSPRPRLRVASVWPYLGSPAAFRPLVEWRHHG